MRKRVAGLIVLWSVCGAGVAQAQVREDNGFSLDFGIGYSKLNIAGENVRQLDGADGAASHINFKWAPPDARGLRLGFSVDIAGWREEFTSVNEDEDEFITDAYQELSLFIPEVRVGYYIPFGDPRDRHFFIEPSIGVGLAVGYFEAGDVFFNRFDSDDYSKTRANIAFRPAVQAGYAWDRFAAGVEASYLWTHLDFGNEVGGDIESWYVGGFFRFRF